MFIDSDICFGYLSKAVQFQAEFISIDCRQVHFCRQEKWFYSNKFRGGNSPFSYSISREFCK